MVGDNPDVTAHCNSMVHVPNEVNNNVFLEPFAEGTAESSPVLRRAFEGPILAQGTFLLGQ